MPEDEERGVRLGAAEVEEGAGRGEHREAGVSKPVRVRAEGGLRASWADGRMHRHVPFT